MKFLTLLVAAPLFAQTVERPKILGIAHVAYFVSDLAKARAYYEDFLGFAELPFTLKKPDGSERIAFIKINDNQYVELFAEDPKNDGRLNHIAIYTDNADRMRDYLASKNIKVPEKVGKGQTGNKNFTIRDPEGHGVEIVEYQPDSRTSQEKGKEIPASRISSHIAHTGVTIGSLSAAMKFYGDILGFKEFWRGGGDPAVLSWVNMRVPDGDDYVELMLYRDPPSPERRGSANHICLVVPNVEDAIAKLEARPARKSYTRKIEWKVGVNRKRQSNFFDPDGTRAELMEPSTIDGKPTPSSAAPPPIL